MRKLLYLCLPLVSFVLLTSCIKEDYSDCERCKLVFTYLGDGSSDVFPNHITSVSLFVFDQNERLVRTKRLEQNQLKAHQGVNFNLEPGKYRIVGVGNDYELTDVSNTDACDMSQIIFHHPNCKTRAEGVVQSNDSLYLGSKEIVIPESYWYHDTVRFYSSHLKVSYTVRDYVNPNATRAAQGYLDLRIKNLLPQTDFTNRAHGELMTYNPAFKFNTSNGDHTTYLNIMRHSADCNVEFELVDRASGEVVHTLLLADFLRDFPQIDVTKQEVLIPILLEFKNIGVNVTINDWTVEDVTPGFGKGDDEEPSTEPTPDAEQPENNNQ
ncbi:MAG: FimB/Mfa2 family fimbrial subunit [Rikenellaceae bacterium]|nr:FimB/Mfa2 family fimbrial subunit [Rikenellaceae bacterium]